MFLLAGAYVAAGRLGLALDAVSGFATVVWAPSGIALAGVLRFGFRVWPGIAAGAFVVNATHGAPFWVAGMIAAGNTLEVLAAAYALRRAGFRPALERVEDVVALVCAALASTVLAATNGVAALELGGLIDPARVAFTWRAWWIGDATGLVLVTPLLLVWRGRAASHRATGSKREAMGLALSIAACGTLVFHGPWLDAAMIDTAQPYLLFPLLLWAAFRFEQRGAASATLATSVLAIAGTVRGRGPFAGAELQSALADLQLFMSSVALTGLVLGAVIGERRRAQQALHREVEVRRVAEAEAQRQTARVRVLLERSQDAISARDEFLSIASHELLTPVSAIALQLQGVRRLLVSAAGEIVTDVNAKAVARLDNAIASTHRLARLVDDLLDVSRITAQRLELHREPCDLTEVSRDVAERASEQARRAGCELTVSAEGPVLGEWDRTRLEQVLTNLLSNAIKYGPGRPIQVTVSSGDDHAFLSVRDHGIGISDEEAERIFERFERAVSARHYGGLGLGLYIARQIVVAHGGSIAVSSAPESGATFSIDLPLRAPVALGERA